MGALIALRYSVTFPAKVSTLLLFNPPVFTDIAQLESIHKSSRRRTKTLLSSPTSEGHWQALNRIPHTKTKHRPAINFADTISMSKHARKGSYQHILGQSSLLSDLGNTSVPVLFVNGRYDRTVYQQNLRDVELPQNVTLTHIETGHHPLVKNIELGETLIREFINK